MLYPPVAELLTKVESRYLLVNLLPIGPARSPQRRRNSMRTCRRSL